MPKIIKARMIDERRIELYWDTQVRNADEEKYFKVEQSGKLLKLTHWKKTDTWDYGTVYQKEHMRTTICLEQPVSTAEQITVTPDPEISDYMDHTYGTQEPVILHFEPYYTQYFQADCGIKIKAGEQVQYSTMEKAAAIVDIMVKKIPKTCEVMKRAGVEIAVYGLLESAYDIPEHRMGYLLATRHVEGFGGTAEAPVSSVSEANVIRLRSGRYATMYRNEMILVHEFAHAIHLVGFQIQKGEGFYERVNQAYEHALTENLWGDTYAISNFEEYFATLSTIWFNVMQEGVDGKWDGIRGPVNTRSELKIYDPYGWKLMNDIYPDSELPVPWNVNENHYDIYGNLIKFTPYELGEQKFEWGFIK